MGVSVQITPIYGSHATSHAVSHLLTIDGFNILLDIGWDISFDREHLENLREIAPKVNAVLLSHADISHLGALPYAFRYLKLNAPVFATLPVWRMGHMFLYNAYLSRSAQTEFSLFNLDDVDSAFELEDRFHLLKYQQRHPLNAYGADKLIITPHGAGHMLGGAIWSIQKETETILYAVHFNHRRERHLNPTTLNSFSRPSHLIISATRADSKTESTKPAALVDLIRSTISQSGNVLIPVDTAGRVIELAILLDDFWQNDSFLRSATLVILHDLSVRTFEFARSMIEWMSDEVVRRFDVSRDNIFDMKHVKLLQSVKQLDQFSKPLVVLASSVSLEVGASRHLFTQWCSQAQNSVILIDRPPPNTLYATLHDHVTKSEKKTSSDDVFHIPVTIRRKEYLKGEELQKWRESERQRKAAELEQKRKEEEDRKKEELKALEVATTESIAQGSGKMDERNVDNKFKVEHRELKAVNDNLAPMGDDEKILEFMRHFNVGPRRPNLATFPFQPAPRPSWDEYGQIVDTSCFMIGEDPGEGAPFREVEEKKQTEIANDVDLIREEVPAEYVEEEVTLNVACKLHVMDFAGLCDGDSLKRLMKEVEPRHVSLVAGNEEETQHFKQYLESQLFAQSRLPSSGFDRKEGSFVVAPRDLESVDITSRTSVCGFSLQDKLISGLRWETVNLSHIAFVDAVVMQERDASGKQMLAMNGTREDEDMMIMTDIGEKSVGVNGARDNGDASSGGHGTIMIGTVMLNQLLDKLRKAGLKAEFAGGALCVQNAETGVVVLVKKTAAQGIALEGAFSEEYMKIRDVLYEELIIPR
ncbi:Cleavage and polyadenylation specificity factor [Gracilaria domingensis]|nr:Cleavage and polyadenylation specificity factor [Gracilaria domingensis]